MEFKRDSVIALYLAGKPQVAIVRAFQHLNVNKSFVSRTIARYRDAGSCQRGQLKIYASDWLPELKRRLW